MDLPRASPVEIGVEDAILSFRDAVIPAPQASVGSVNYEDDVLRTFSLLPQHEIQMSRFVGVHAALAGCLWAVYFVLFDQTFSSKQWPKE